MCNVDVLLAKLLRQALRERAHSELARRKRARSSVSTQAGGRASEEERAPLTLVVEIKVLECGDGLAREGKGSDNVGVDALLNFFRRDLEERLRIVSSETSKKGYGARTFQTPKAVLNRATRRGDSGHCDLIEPKADWIDEGE